MTDRIWKMFKGQKHNQMVGAVGTALNDDKGNGKDYLTELYKSFQNQNSYSRYT